MSNPFEDLRQAVVVRPISSSVVVVRPTNSPGPQGPSAPEIKIQYSNEGTSWHDVPLETDRYLRFSTNNGASWNDAIYFNNLAETLEWVEKAKKWAENPEDVEVETGKYSALHHKEKALDAQVGAETAKTAAETARIGAETAKTAAETARIGAETAEANALASENKAKKWAQEDEDVEVETGKYSAYHWAQKAGKIVVSPMHGDEAHTEDYVKEGDPD